MSSCELTEFDIKDTDEEFSLPASDHLLDEDFSKPTNERLFLESLNDSEEKIQGDPKFIGQLWKSALRNLKGKVDHIPKPRSNDYLKGWEVGDDRVDTSNNPLRLSLSIVLQEEVFDMKTSLEDTFISTRLWNFCEVTNVVPSSRLGSFHHARKRGTFDEIEFTDAPTLRIIIDCQKGDRSHSSTIVGKSSMLARKLAANRSDCRRSMMLASFLQDGMLRTGRMSEPKYLPKVLGGAGCKDLFDTYVNTYLYMRSYRGGGYHRLYGSAVEEMKQCVRNLDMGEEALAPLCTFLRKKQEYLHGTYGEYVMIPPEFSIWEGEMPTPVYTAQATHNHIRSVETRLVHSKVLMGQRQAEISLASSRRTADSIFGITPVSAVKLAEKEKSFQARKKYEGALSANSAFKRLLDRQANGHEVGILEKQGFKISTSGKLRFDMYHAEWLHRGGKGQVYSIQDITFPESMYFTDEVSTETDYKISGIPLLLSSRTGIRIETTKCRVGLYQVSSSMLEWADGLSANLRSKRDNQGRSLTESEVTSIFAYDKEWVTDDGLLIAEAVNIARGLNQAAHIGVITADKRLCRRMAQTANINICMLDPTSAIQALPGVEWTGTTTIDRSQLLQSYKGPHLARILVDTGSIMAATASMDTKTTPDTGRLYRKWSPVASQWNLDGTRTALYEIETLRKEAGVKILGHYAPLLDPRGRPSKKTFSKNISAHM